jgi:hypothetical protein
MPLFMGYTKGYREKAHNREYRDSCNNAMPNFHL